MANQLELFNQIINYVDECYAVSYRQLVSQFSSSALLITQMTQDGDLIEVSDNALLGTYKIKLPH